MSHIAKTGNHAERIICSQASILSALGASSIVGAGKGKKTDIILTLVNGERKTFQIKNSDTFSKTTRGHSVDRRSWIDFVTPLRSRSLRAALHDVTQKQQRVKGSTWLCNLFPSTCSSRAESELIVRRSLLGEEEEFAPTDFMATRLNSSKTEIIEIATCPANVLVDHLVSTLYEHPRLVKSCIELGPNIYLQRKGGDKKDKRASDIQTKIKFDQSLSHLFTPVPLPSSVPESTSAPLEPVPV